MNYFIPRFNCYLPELGLSCHRNVKYVLKDLNPKCVWGLNGETPLCVDFKHSSNLLAVNYNHNTFYFIDAEMSAANQMVSLKCGNKQVTICFGNQLLVCVDGEKICSMRTCKLEYVGFENFEESMIVYFAGKRNFVVVIKDKEILAMYYDECNSTDKEKYFMCKLNDCLNHGKVIHIFDKKVDNYLVYLDDFELNLKPEFLLVTFLDCINAGNFGYCNYLLCDDLKQQEECLIKEFFPDFDFFFPLEEKVFVLIKKNTLAGIYKFETDGLIITNIISL